MYQTVSQRGFTDHATAYFQSEYHHQYVQTASSRLLPKTGAREDQKNRHASNLTASRQQRLKREENTLQKENQHFLKRLHSIEPSVNQFNDFSRLKQMDVGSLTAGFKVSQSHQLKQENNQLMKKLLKAEPSIKFEQFHDRSERYEKILSNISRFDEDGKRKTPLMVKQMSAQKKKILFKQGPNRVGISEKLVTQNADKLLKTTSCISLTETNEINEPNPYQAKIPYLKTNEKFAKKFSHSQGKQRSLPELATERQFTGRLGTFCVVKATVEQPVQGLKSSNRFTVNSKFVGQN